MANKGDIQHNLKTGSNSELYFTRENTAKASADYGKLITKKGLYRFPYLTRMTGESLKGMVETIESNELRKGSTASKKRLGNESSEGSLDIELSPLTFDDNLAAAFGNEWKRWTSDTNSAINLDEQVCGAGEFLTRAIVSLGKDEFGNWGAKYNTNENFEPRLLLNDGASGHENGLIDVPAGCIVHELTCGSNDISYDILRHLGGVEDEDLYQRYKHMKINTFSLDVQIGSIVTGSFGFMGTNNPIRKDESDERKDYGSDSADQFIDSGMSGNKFMDSLPDQSTDTDQFTSMEGNLWVNGKNITTGENLSLEINHNMERKNAIFVKKAIATTSNRLDITGSLQSYVVFGETEELYNLAVENKTNEILWLFQDKEVNPEHLYLFQIFKSSFDSPDTNQGGTDVTEDTYAFTSFEERAIRILRITLPKPKSVEFAAASTWTDAGTITVVPNAELGAAADLASYKIVDTLKTSAGTVVDTQTITSGATISDSCLTVTESAFTTTTDGVIREIKVIFNGNEDYAITKTFKNDTSAAGDVTDLTVSYAKERVSAVWVDPTSDDYDHATINIEPDEYDASADYAEGEVTKYSDKYYKCLSAITGGETWDATHWLAIDFTPIFENVNKGVQTYTSKKLPNGHYEVTVKTVDTNGNVSTGVSEVTA